MKNNTRKWNQALLNNLQRLNEKWGFDWKYYSQAEYHFLNAIKEKETAALSVLEIGGGFSNILNIIKYRYPNADVHAIELNEKVAKIAATYIDMVCGDIETMEIPYELEKFDYILMGNVIEYLKDPFAALKRIKPYLKKNGHLMITSPNASHISVISEMIHGRFNRAHGDTLDHEHALHFFTMNDLTQLINDAGYIAESWIFIYSSAFTNRSPEEEALLNAIMSVPGVTNKNDFVFTKSMIVAKKG